MKRDYGGYLFMYAITAISSGASLILMIISCNIFDLCKFGWEVLGAVAMVFIFSILGIYHITRKEPPKNN